MYHKPHVPFPWLQEVSEVVVKNEEQRGGCDSDNWTALLTEQTTD